MSRCLVSSVLLLVLVLVQGTLSVLVLEPEQCDVLLKPKSMREHIQLKRSHFIAGYVEGEAFNDFLKWTQSSWMRVSSGGNEEVFLYQSNRINGTCFDSNVTISVIDDVTARMSVGNVNSSFHLLSTCEDCAVLSATTIVRNLDQIYRKFNLSTAATEDEVSIKALYLMARNTSVSDSDLQHFQDQASCLGFSGKPHYVHEQHHTFCEEDEAVRVHF
ncbi:uncharacterized protein V6R79_016521 [Siganus canaliculatus]